MVEFAPLRIGVVGTGVMGGHHTRTAAALTAAQLIGIYDPDIARAGSIAAQYSITACNSLEALCGQVDAVVVASPTFTHAEVATKCLQAGCHVLIEKPIAATVSEGEELLAIANKIDRVLMIGHLERFNPAVIVARELLANNELFSFELHRLSPTPPRDQSADIIFDLMIHDIDLAFAFSKAPIAAMTANGLRCRYDFIDHVSAMLQFTNGITALLTASAVSQQRVRQARLFAADAQINLDLNARTVTVHRYNSEGNALPTDDISVPAGDPLSAEQTHFLQVIQTGCSLITTPEDGLAALRLAQQIQDTVNENLLICK